VSLISGQHTAMPIHHCLATMPICHTEDGNDDDGQFDETNSLRLAVGRSAQRPLVGRPAGGGGPVPGQRSICVLTDKLPMLPATGNDALFAHARSRRRATEKNDRKWPTMCVGFVRMPAIV